MRSDCSPEASFLSLAPRRMVVAAALGTCLLLAASFRHTSATAAEESATPEQTAKLIATVAAVGGKGEGNVAAVQALQQLQQQPAGTILPLLAAFEDSGVIAQNLLRSAVESIAASTRKAEGQLPVEELLAFVNDRSHHPRARRLAFELIQQVQPEQTAKLLADGSLLTDPSPEIRRDAVQHAIGQAEEAATAGEKEESVKQYQAALRGAVDDDQVKLIAAALKKAGIEVNLQAHFGFLPQWRVIGPFDNKDKVGFAAVYPPEEKVDFDATYDGQLGKVNWQLLKTDDSYGIIDVAEQLENWKGSVVYAATIVESAEEQQVEVRLGTPNAWKLWINGKLLFGREEYHRGMKLDQYRVPVTLQPGRNVILLKVCQNEQTESWAQRYRFQVRVCDAAGSALPETDLRLISRAGAGQTP